MEAETDCKRPLITASLGITLAQCTGSLVDPLGRTRKKKPTRMIIGTKRAEKVGVQNEIETYLVKFKTYSVLRDYETRSCTR